VPKPPSLTPLTDDAQTKPATTLLARLKLWAAWGLGAGLLAWLLSHTPVSQVRDALARPGMGTWALTLGGLLLSYGLRAARLQVVLDLDGHHRAPHRWLGLRTDALRVILMHNAAVNLLPMRAGELSFPWLASRELQLSLPRAVACLLWMRVQDLVVLVLLGLLLWPGLDWALRLGALASLAGAWHVGSWMLKRWFLQHAELAGDTPSVAGQAGMPGRIGQLLLRMRAALLEPAHHRPLAWGLTLANWSLKLAAGAFLLSAISTAPWPTAWAGALGGELAAIVPLQGPAGFGTYEAGVWAGFAANLPPRSAALNQAVSAALALHLCFLLCAVLAGASAWLMGSPQPVSPQPGTPPAAG
jgi:hypothetical protein